MNPDDPSNGPRTLHADLRGLPNPEPVLALAEWAARLGPGETLDVITDGRCDGDNLATAGTQDRSVDLSKPGKYLFVCNLPGHYQQGMFAVVTVTQ